ncbi:FkbM family methyltransferase [Candidatus Sumerlaeota bacterium]|nr:FkbM family methyltransferase [Candidatus Sumerlaeota bacterium]
MGLIDLAKAPLRPLVHAYYRIVYPPSPGRHAQEEKQRALESAYLLFRDLSCRENVSEVSFRDGRAILTLSDGRKYYYDATHRVARMYSVPYTGTFESKETEFVRGLVKPGQVCLDVGANFGWYTVLLSRNVGPAGAVHAFEPLPSTLEVLERNIELNGCRNVTVTQAALDEMPGERDIYLPDIGVSGSFHLHEYRETFDTIQCPCLRLDDYCSERGVDRVDFIKADIEGAEWPMLKGATETLRRHRPILFLEVQERSTTLFGYKPSDLFGWLAEMGYRSHYVTDSGALVEITDWSGALPDYNFFFLPRESVGGNS